MADTALPPGLPRFERGQRLELDITDIAFGGDGIGRVDSFVVFVPFVIAGERVEVEIVEVRKRYARADLVRVLAASTQRVEPRCPYYARCAGCQYQHIAYTHQLELKQKQIRDIFQRIGGVKDPPIEPVTAAPRPYGYRNKIVVHGPGRPGFWTVRGRSVIAVQQCPIACPEINARLAEASRQELADMHLTLRCDSAGQVACFVESRTGLSPVSLGDSSAQAGEKPTTANVSATGCLSYSVLGRELRIPPGSFFQVNLPVIELALEHVRAVFRARGCRTVVDAYCGVGLFALMLADLARHLYGIEVDAAAIQAANTNAARWELTNCEFYQGRTERLLSYTLRQCNLEETCLILDPPRSGCGKAVLRTLREHKPRQLIYVSCAPPMLARDLQELLKSGYRLERVTPFDMFPQTKHCETVAELSRTTDSR